MDELLYYANLSPFKEIINSNDLRIAKTNTKINEFIIMLDFIKNDKTIFVVLPTLSEAQTYYDDLIKYLPFEKVLFFPADELITSEMLSSQGDFLYERLQTLISLLSDNKYIVITNTNGIIKREFPKEVFAKCIFKLKKRQEIKREELIKKLIILGYKYNYTALKTGDFSKRGSIVDIYLFGEENPIRIDFFADEIDSIKYFNPDSQRSFKEIEEIEIKPIIEMTYDDEALELALKNIAYFKENNILSEIEKGIIDKDISDLNLRDNTVKLMRYAAFFYNEDAGVLDYKKDKKIYYIDPVKIEDVYKNMLLDLNEYEGRLGGHFISKLEPYIPLNKQVPNILIEGTRTIADVDVYLDHQDVLYYKGNEEAINKDLAKYSAYRKILLAIKNDKTIDKVKKSLFEHNLFYNEGNISSPKDSSNIFFINNDLPSLCLKNNDVFIINEEHLMNDNQIIKKAPRYKSIYKNSIKVNRYDELKTGDYIVHYDYGIGKYLGIKTLINNGVKRDYIYCEYANASSLYVPVENISSIMKYASFDVPGIEMNEIGGTSWARTKEKVRKKVRDISDRLIALYSKREKTNGFAFPLDDELQADFEADFPYELTEDQKHAVIDVKHDMERNIPMDRLVCGDVGYGKTEVALRAAFKAVLANKQVALLCPTTILSDQHYHTFLNRMVKFGIRVELLNRFVSQKKQKEVFEGLKAGQVEVVVGTHKLLNKDIVFKDLGLLIVDEEQRFGVVHKERIKEMKVNVDCITLSATPIPRTLQMSMLGIKDLSMIETPPKNRYPIQTYVIEQNDAVIRDAIEREIARHGQVFYLYNKVETIEDVAIKVAKMCPNARVCFAHGRLKSNELEKRVYDFINKKYDVLVCTTIIETGIDIPETNTLIINDADRLGLAQLYQIRGRVGRSNKIAYAYLMYEPQKILTKEAEKRLEAIKEFNELGSGFKIAMRDLAIRGSGDLLGAEQSGFVESVGIEMYMKILNEEINNIKPNAVKPNPITKKPLVSLTISEDYIGNEDMRITMHKRIEGLQSLEDLANLSSELIDRFGPIDDDTLNYMYEKAFKNMANHFGFNDVNINEFKIISLEMDEKRSKEIKGDLWFKVLNNHKNLILKYIHPHIILQTRKEDSILSGMKDIINYLEDIKNNIEK